MDEYELLDENANSRIKGVEADAMILFAAMIGTGLLIRAIADTPWIRQMQFALLGVLPWSEKCCKADAK